MSILKNLLGNFMPHFESRRSSATLNALNATLTHAVDGDESALIFINAASALTATYIVEGSPDGVTWLNLICYPYTSVNGTLPAPAQPIFTEASTAAIQRVLCCATGGLQSIRVRLSSYTSGSCAVNINSDAQMSISPYLRDQRAATLMVTGTAAVSTGVTVTLPAVAGLRHYIDFVKVTRSATAALTASATPVLVTTTNINGSPVLTFGSDAGGIGVDIEKSLDFGASGIASTTINTATTIVAPIWTGVIWRINVAYRLGL